MSARQEETNSVAEHQLVSTVISYFAVLARTIDTRINHLFLLIDFRESKRSHWYIDTDLWFIEKRDYDLVIK